MVPRLEVMPAGPEHQAVLENLLELYIHDFSDFAPVDVGEDGRFGYPQLSRYLHEPAHRAFLARVDGKLAGFALVQRMGNPPGEDANWDMAEFFILRRYRRLGAGTRFAQAIWNLCPGVWTVRVRADNGPGLRFWAAAIAGFTGCPAASEALAVEGVAWRSFSFGSSH